MINEILRLLFVMAGIFWLGYLVGGAKAYEGATKKLKELQKRTGK